MNAKTPIFSVSEVPGDTAQQPQRASRDKVHGATTQAAHNSASIAPFPRGTSGTSGDTPQRTVMHALLSSTVANHPIVSDRPHVATNSTPMHEGAASQQPRGVEQQPRAAAAGNPAPLCRKRQRELPANPSIDDFCAAVWDSQAHARLSMDQEYSVHARGMMSSVVSPVCGVHEDIGSDEFQPSWFKCKVCVIRRRAPRH